MPAVYSSDGKSVTITLKGWKWSDGTQITARDIQFWQNLVTANKDNWAGYSPGEYPDNVLSTTIDPTNPLKITFNLSQTYGSYFFTYNELSQITPLPQQVWDKELATGAVGNYDETPAGAVRGVRATSTRSRRASRPTTPTRSGRSVSGPWKLKSMDTAGNVSMVPNTGYGGPVKPTLTRVQRGAVHAGHRGVQRAQVRDVAAATRRSTMATSRKRRPGTVDARQRLQLRTLDGLADHVLPGELHQPDQRADLQPAVLPTGDAGPGGPEHLHQQGVLRVRVSDLRPGARPSPPRTSSIRSRSRIRIHTARARRSRCSRPTAGRSTPGGTSTCTSPGTGSGQCGAGVRQGAKASFSLQYESGQRRSIRRWRSSSRTTRSQASRST